ncbi:uncharacterized protein PHACADRAFT_194370 [Phanerochaete carnosa HHB-10118-sp]|uniref:Uncharacterized protein n=1 Tax=Phanerochaete carnosa (strain HHB-10118-sp) TaxID=650164 RepID=K5X1X3_PHACS|nr:uncharacterized protein PHACADRAFT_194370 [Phanerochaete carnosa HHB-10118-sp]EKM56782.1 hypothetical protein PHACADRAFT_194370 [Phanerochaete carnosa HHB-10118-sp]
MAIGFYTIEELAQWLTRRQYVDFLQIFLTARHLVYLSQSYPPHSAMLAFTTELVLCVLSVLVISASAVPAAPTKVGMDLPKGVPKVNDHTGAAINVPHKKRAICEFAVPGEYPGPANEPFAGANPVRREVCHE